MTIILSFIEFKYDKNVNVNNLNTNTNNGFEKIISNINRYYDDVYNPDDRDDDSSSRGGECVSELDVCIGCFASVDNGENITAQGVHNAYFAGYTNIVIKDAYSCSCPFGTGIYNKTSSKGPITLEDERELYLDSEGISENDNNTELVQIGFDDAENECASTYCAKIGTFVDITVHTIFHSQCIVTDTVHLNSNQIVDLELEYLWAKYLNVFDVAQNRFQLTVVTFFLMVLVVLQILDKYTRNINNNNNNYRSGNGNGDTSVSTFHTIPGARIYLFEGPSVYLTDRCTQSKLYQCV